MMTSTEQLELNLYDTIDNYRRNDGKFLNQVALQTGYPKGTFKQGDPHPNVSGLFYSKWERGENWLERHQVSKSSFLNQEALQTGFPIGTFKQGDPHPIVKGLFYKERNREKERWASKKNLQKKIDYNTRYRGKNKEKRKLYYKQYAEKNRERIKKKKAEYDSRPERKACRVAYMKTENYKLSYVKYRKSRKGRALSRKVANTRRARKAKVLTELTEEKLCEIQQIYTHAVRVSKKLQIPFEVDHTVPLSKGGLHHPLNLQVVPAVWNRRKGDRHTERWLPNGM